MGNSATKGDNRKSKLSENEQRALQAAIGKSANKSGLTEYELINKLNFPKGGEDWLSAIWAFMTRKSKSAGFNELKCMYEIAVYGQLQEKEEFITFLPEYTQQPFEEFCYWLVQGAEASSPAWQYWERIRCPISEESRQLFVKYLNEDSTGTQFVNLETLLMRRPIILALLESILRCGFKCSEGHHNRLFPVLLDVETSVQRPSILTSTEVLFVNAVLPHDLPCEWRLLFSTVLHGQSFSTLLSRIINQGPTLILLKDTENHVFGGFASVSWSMGPNFIGDDRCFVFSLRPRMAMFPTTGYNDHYMYLNQNQQTLPNGLGMGGQFDYFALWLDSEFGIGHSSKTCTTYSNYSQLSKETSFRIDHVEVWAVGRLPQPDDEDEDGPPSKSVLDRDPGAKAILEMMDRPQHSEGLREPEST